MDWFKSVHKTGRYERVYPEKCRLAVDFGDWFGGDRFNGFIRMNLATSRENVEIGVKRIIDGILGEK